MIIMFIDKLFQTWYLKWSYHRNWVGNNTFFVVWLVFSLAFSGLHCVFFLTYFDYSHTLHSDDRKVNKSKAFQIYQLTQQTVHNSINYLYHSIMSFATNSLFILGENSNTCQINKPHIHHTISGISYGHNSNFCGTFLEMLNILI